MDVGSARGFDGPATGAGAAAAAGLADGELGPATELGSTAGLAGAIASSPSSSLSKKPRRSAMASVSA